MFVPWRIVSYNILSGSSRGPDIFGTEPWHFYIRNLLLNFNACLVLAICAGPVLGLQFLLSPRSSTRLTTLRSMMISTTFYMWLGIFSAQAHKEERFMYPAYPFVCLNAAITMHAVLNYVGHSSPKSTIAKIPANVKLALVGACALAITTAGIVRTVGTAIIVLLLKSTDHCRAQSTPMCKATSVWERNGIGFPRLIFCQNV